MSDIGMLLIFISSFLPWIDSPIGPDRSSMGYIAAVIAIFGLLLRFSDSAASIAGAAGIGITLFFIVHLALFNPFLGHLIDENAQYAQILKFSETYLPPNLSTEPDFQSALRIRTVWNLLETAVYFSGPGLWACMAGSLSVLLSGNRNPKSLKLTTTALILCVFIPITLLFYGALAQHIAEKGDQLMTDGDYDNAIRQYEKALGMAIPAAAERIYVRIGEAYIRLGRSDHPAALFYDGLIYERNRASDSAIHIWLKAVETAPPLLKTILSGRIARTYIATGLQAYQNNALSQAVILWEKALSFDPSRIQAAYYLSRAYFTQARYRQSIEMGKRVLSVSRNKLLNADTLANIGDSYWKLNEFATARKAYQTALALDPVDNARIVKALGGT
jgi:tetratricopeptide (TPR) repeat protein